MCRGNGVRPERILNEFQKIVNINDKEVRLGGRWKNQGAREIEDGDQVFCGGAYRELEVWEVDRSNSGKRTFRSYIGVLLVDGKSVVFVSKFVCDKNTDGQNGFDENEFILKMASILFMKDEFVESNGYGLNEIFFFRNLNLMWRVLKESEESTIDKSVFMLPLMIWTEGLKFELGRGIYRTPKYVEKARRSVKGKILVSRQIKVPPHRKHIMWCRYNEFTPDNEVNRSLYYLVSSFVQELRREKENLPSDRLWRNLRSLQYTLGQTVASMQIGDVHWNRVSMRFKSYYDLGVELEKAMKGQMVVRGDEHTVKSLTGGWLLELTKLWELIVLSVVNRVFPGDRYEVEFQKEVSFQDGGYKVPDIVVSRNGKIKFIFDAKYRDWKGNLDYEGEDKPTEKQMRKYLDITDKVVFVYPVWDLSDALKGGQKYWKGKTHDEEVVLLKKYYFEDKNGWVLFLDISKLAEEDCTLKDWMQMVAEGIKNVFEEAKLALYEEEV